MVSENIWVEYMHRPSLADIVIVRIVPKIAVDGVCWPTRYDVYFRRCPKTVRSSK